MTHDITVSIRLHKRQRGDAGETVCRFIVSFVVTTGATGQKQIALLDITPWDNSSAQP